jgi:hypothetical protein
VQNRPVGHPNVPVEGPNAPVEAPNAPVGHPNRPVGRSNSMYSNSLCKNPLRHVFERRDQREMVAQVALGLRN